MWGPSAPQKNTKTIFLIFSTKSTKKENRSCKPLRNYKNKNNIKSNRIQKKRKRATIALLIRKIRERSTNFLSQTKRINFWSFALFLIKFPYINIEKNHMKAYWAVKTTKKKQHLSHKRIVACQLRYLKFSNLIPSKNSNYTCFFSCIKKCAEPAVAAYSRSPNSY